MHAAILVEHTNNSTALWVPFKDFEDKHPVFNGVVWDYYRACVRSTFAEAKTSPGLIEKEKASKPWFMI